MGTNVLMEDGFLRRALLVVVMGGALAAVLVADERTSSFLAGLACGAGLVFVASFLGNRFARRAAARSAGEYRGDDERPDR